MMLPLALNEINCWEIQFWRLLITRIRLSMVSNNLGPCLILLIRRSPFCLLPCLMRLIFLMMLILGRMTLLTCVEGRLVEHHLRYLMRRHLHRVQILFSKLVLRLSQIGWDSFLHFDVHIKLLMKLSSLWPLKPLLSRWVCFVNQVSVICLALVLRL